MPNPNFILPEFVIIICEGDNPPKASPKWVKVEEIDEIEDTH